MSKIPTVTSSEMAALDKRMIQEYHIDLLQMMENAGRALATHSTTILGGSLVRRKVTVLAGKGNKGGGGLASARHIHNSGADVRILLSSKKEELKEAPAKQLTILESMGISIVEDFQASDLSGYDLVIDALLGYNQRGNPRGKVADLVIAANSSGSKILALDIPTGLDPDTGHPNQPCIRADQTLTLALPKHGLVQESARPYVGELYLADISVPREYYESLGLEGRPIFADGYIVPIDFE